MFRIRVAKGFWGRGRGLIGKKSLSIDEALLIPKCRQVHTWFMRFPIDVAFVNAVGIIVEIKENIRPWRLSRRVAEASACLEGVAGYLQKNNLKVGDGVKNYFER